MIKSFRNLGGAQTAGLMGDGELDRYFCGSGVVAICEVPLVRNHAVEKVLTTDGHEWTRIGTGFGRNQLAHHIVNFRRDANVGFAISNSCPSVCIRGLK
jgi:hypothetical protein